MGHAHQRRLAGTGHVGVARRAARAGFTTGADFTPPEHWTCAAQGRCARPIAGRAGLALAAIAAQEVGAAPDPGRADTSARIAGLGDQSVTQPRALVEALDATAIGLSRGRRQTHTAKRGGAGLQGLRARVALAPVGTHVEIPTALASSGAHGGRGTSLGMLRVTGIQIRARRVASAVQPRRCLETAADVVTGTCGRTFEGPGVDAGIAGRGIREARIGQHKCPAVAKPRAGVATATTDKQDKNGQMPKRHRPSKPERLRPGKPLT